MEIYLIRHTKTDTPKGLCYGQTDVELTKNFLTEARDILEKLPNCDIVFSSPLSRCTRLANLIRDDVVLDSRLLELHFGDWENVLFSEIESNVLTHWSENFVTFAPPNGENFVSLYSRVERFWFDLIHIKRECVFIVTHAGVIRAFLAFILKLPLENAFQFCVDVGSIHKLRYENNYTYIEFLNK